MYLWKIVYYGHLSHVDSADGPAAFDRVRVVYAVADELEDARLLITEIHDDSPVFHSIRRIAEEDTDLILDSAERHRMRAESLAQGARPRDAAGKG